MTLARRAQRREIVRVNRNNAPSAADLIFLVIAPLTAIRGSVKLTQSDGDLAAHIRMGETLLATGHLPAHSLVSYTAQADPMVAHAWLSELIFALLFRLGGLPLLSIVTGIVIGVTHGAIALFLRKRGADPRWAIVAALLSFSLASTHWLTRPHLFSIAGAALTLFLLESDRPRRWIYAFPLFALWANLHGGWLFGLVMIGAYIGGDLAEAALSKEARTEWVQKARDNAILLGVAGAATLLNPYGITLHREVLSAVNSSSLASNMAEFLPPNFTDPGQWPFLLAILGTVALFAIGTRRIQLPWLAVILVSLFFALRSFRNIALFGVSAWPLIALHAARSLPGPRRPFPLFSEFARLDPLSRTGILGVPVAGLMLLLGLNRGTVAGVEVIPDRFNDRAFPTVAVAKAKAAALSGNVFDAWAWGGYIMYAWPQARLHVDPLKFNSTTITSYSIIEDLRPGWQGELDKWDIRTVIVKAKSPTAMGLAREPGWGEWHRDSTAVIFRRSQDSTRID